MAAPFWREPACATLAEGEPCEQVPRVPRKVPGRKRRSNQLSDDQLKFPDPSRSELDRILEQLVQTAHQVLGTQGRLRSLLKASRVIADELELPVVLRRIVEAAVELVGSRYGAIGVIAPDGTLEQFIHVGMPDELVSEIGHLPEGHGLLGALIDDQQPIRLERLGDDPRSSGFPPGHPPMETFLGVPIRVRDEVYGNLYLAERFEGFFSEEDQELLVALAATAGAAIDHARLFDESQRRHKWSAASAEVTAALLAEGYHDSLALIADRVASLADAELVCVVVPLSAATMVVETARGALAANLVGTIFQADRSLAARAYESRQPVLSDQDLISNLDNALEIGPTMAVPLTSSNEPSGVLTVSRSPGGKRFTNADLDMVADFAAQASVALRLAELNADHQRLALLEERGRIARDLHDHVIQRLFGAGLTLQAIASTISSAPARERVMEQVDVLDAAISDIRTAIFTLTSKTENQRPSVRHRIVDLLGETSQMFDYSPQLQFAGPVDLMIPDDLADDLVAVVREGLANVARHAQANTASISISIADDAVTVQIDDDGIGIDPKTAGASSGTNNLAGRAGARGGRFALETRKPGGTRFVWTAPLPQVLEGE